ncbi:pilus assembly protein HicB [Vineibacter terrae]|uniref:pilus assembly protein HicB n=1 Tax=Vineibacter terrae TaxID=2586908 RepID=UPI001C49C374|nr:pilus assembly protein HicB [Vineibacter terrae]
MSKKTYPLKLPESVKHAAARLALQDGVSLNQWIAAAVAEKVGVVETAATFLKARAGAAKPTDLLYYLDRARQEAPGEADRIDGPETRPAGRPVKARR